VNLYLVQFEARRGTSFWCQMQMLLSQIPQRGVMLLRSLNCMKQVKLILLYVV